MKRFINVRTYNGGMKSVLLKSKDGSKRAELEEALNELDNDPKLLDSIKEFVRFHTGTDSKKAAKH